MPDKKKILVIDDEPDVLAYFSTLFEDHGYDARTAVDGLRGMKKVREERPDLVTLDIAMPEKSGVRMYKELKEDDELKEIPVIIVTGVTSGGYRTTLEEFLGRRAKLPKPEGFLQKPVDPEELLQKIGELIE